MLLFYFSFYDCDKQAWCLEALESVDFPTEILPNVVRPGQEAGKLSREWLGLKKGIPVLAALGDLQCSALVNLKPNTAFLNISTSCQLCFVAQKDLNPLTEKAKAENEAVDFFPFFDDTFLTVAASLNGGNVLECFVDNLLAMYEEIDSVFNSDTEEGNQEPKKEPNQSNGALDRSKAKARLWRHLTEKGLKFLEGTDFFRQDTNNSSYQSISIEPTIFGERHKSTATATIANIKPIVKLGELWAAACVGIVDNVLKMMPLEKLKANGITKLMATGSGLNNPIMRMCLENRFTDLTAEVKEGVDSDVGAAVAAS